RANIRQHENETNFPCRSCRRHHAAVRFVVPAHPCESILKRLLRSYSSRAFRSHGRASESNTIRIGIPGTQTASSTAGISGATVPDGVTVVVGADGHLGTTTSSSRYKERIEPMNHASEAILSLKPVTFRYKKELDPQGIPQFGLVAE